MLEQGRTVGYWGSMEQGVQVGDRCTYPGRLFERRQPVQTA